MAGIQKDRGRAMGEGHAGYTLLKGTPAGGGPWCREVKWGLKPTLGPLARPEALRVGCVCRERAPFFSSRKGAV